MTKYFNFPCQTEMVWMFKNICKNIKPYKFSNAKNIELLVYFYKKILRTWKMLKFQKPKNIGSLTWILLVLIKKKECIKDKYEVAEAKKVCRREHAPLVRPGGWAHD